MDDIRMVKVYKRKAEYTRVGYHLYRIDFVDKFGWVKVRILSDNFFKKRFGAKLIDKLDRLENGQVIDGSVGGNRDYRIKISPPLNRQPDADELILEYDIP